LIFLPYVSIVSIGDKLTIAKETGRRLGLGTNMYPITSLLGNHKDDIIAYYPIDESVDGFSGVFPGLFNSFFLPYLGSEIHIVTLSFFFLTNYVQSTNTIL